MLPNVCYMFFKHSVTHTVQAVRFSEILGSKSGCGSTVTFKGEKTNHENKVIERKMIFYLYQSKLDYISSQLC